MVFKSSGSVSSISESEYENSHSYNTRLSVKRIKARKKATPEVAPKKNVRKTRNISLEIQTIDATLRDLSRSSSVAKSDVSTPLRAGYLQEYRQEIMPSDECRPRRNYANSCIGKCGSYSKSWPLFLGLGALILIAVPLSKLLSGVKNDLADVQDEVDELKGKIGEPVSKRGRSGSVSPGIKDMILKELYALFYDKTGRIDFALESSGGSITRVIGTDNYVKSGGSFFGFTLCEGIHGPRAVIQAANEPGECWAFKGSIGGVVIRLLGPVLIDSVSMEHIPKNLSPTGEVDSAPHEFAIFGVDHPNANINSAKFLGKFKYSIDKAPIQTFNVEKMDIPFHYVYLKVLSNHGNKKFTCVYRLRVHGKLAPAKDKSNS